MNRTIACTALLLVSGVLAAPVLAAGDDLSSLGAKAAGKRLCEDAESAKTPSDLDTIFDRGQELFGPYRQRVGELRRAHDRAKDDLAEALRQNREQVLKTRGVDDASLDQLQQEIERLNRSAAEYDSLAPSERTNWVGNPHEILHDRIVRLEAAKRTRKIVDGMSDEAIRSFGTSIMKDRYNYLTAEIEGTEYRLNAFEPNYQQWKEMVEGLSGCIEARRTALKEEPKPLTAATAKGIINGDCTGKISLFGETTKSSWPLRASIQLDRNPQGKVHFSLVTEERGQKLTLNGAYGPNFTASGGAGTIRMSVKGTLSEHPDRPELLQGSGTGQSTDSSDMQVNCSFAWKTEP